LQDGALGVGRYQIGVVVREPPQHGLREAPADAQLGPHVEMQAVGGHHLVGEVEVAEEHDVGRVLSVNRVVLRSRGVPVRAGRGDAGDVALHSAGVGEIDPQIIQQGAEAGVRLAGFGAIVALALQVEQAGDIEGVALVGEHGHRVGDGIADIIVHVMIRRRFVPEGIPAPAPAALHDHEILAPRFPERASKLEFRPPMRRAARVVATLLHEQRGDVVRGIADGDPRARPVLPPELHLRISRLTAR
jgi:hypothetical protein